jgi:hypothetical protein
LTKDLQTILSLKRALESARKGMGISQALLREFSRSKAEGREVARLLLLGFPLKKSLSPMSDKGTEEVSMLSSLVVGAPRSSVSVVGRSGMMLATTLESWIRERENRILEQKVMRFRGFVTSGVLGAVTAMMASLGPVVGNLNFLTNAAQSGGGDLLIWAAGLAGVSSGMLGLYLSGRGFVLNVVIALSTFALVASAVAPLTNIPALSPWGVK